jgi:hypothetical protein
MAKKSIKAAALAALATAMATAAGSARAEGPVIHRFTIGSEAFSVPVPEGYCLPQGADVALSEELAALDVQSHTLADLNRCGSIGEDYIHIKTPRTARPVPLPKALFLPLIARELESASGQKLMNDAMDKAGKQITDKTENAISLDEMKPRYGGLDEDCVYMVATGKVVVGEEALSLMTAGCMTVVDKRFITVAAYSGVDSGTTEEQLKARARAVARSIARVPAGN